MMKRLSRKRQLSGNDDQPSSHGSNLDKFKKKAHKTDHKNLNLSDSSLSDNCDSKYSNDNSFDSGDEFSLSTSLPNISSNQSVKCFLNHDKFKYDPKKENQFITSVEHINWIHNNHCMYLSNLCYPESTFEQLNLNEQYEFVDKEIYDTILKCKQSLNKFDKSDIRRAKSSSNPFESIGKCIFQNRSALKMANLDYLCNYEFTNPKIKNDKDFLYFCDLCGGVGGFSEYLFWVKSWQAKGFGLTLKAENDFNLERLSSVSLSSFHPFYGESNDGDIYKPKNLVGFRNYVLNQTEKRGCDIVVADGAFSCQGRESQQELLSKRLYLCQFVCALSTLRKGGNFLCKLFDIYSEFSVGLIYLMYRCFEQFAIIKPISSRPANSERYIVFKGKLDNCEQIDLIENFLFKINCSLDSFELSARLNSSDDGSEMVKEDFHRLIPLEMIKQDHAFYSYICNSNNDLGRRQIHFLSKESAFAANSSLQDNHKMNFRRKFLNQWKIPSTIQHTSANLTSPERKFERLMSEHNINITKCAFLYYEPNELKQLNMIKYPFNYLFCTLTENRDTSSQRGLFQSFKNAVYFFDTSSNQWINQTVKLEKFKLPENTVIYGELTSEFKGEGSGQKKVIAFHIIDSLILGNLNVCKKPIDERIMITEKFLKVSFFEQNVKNFIIRVKKYFRLPEIENYFSELELKECKGIRKERVCLPIEENNFSIASGLLIYNKLKPHYGSNKSQSTDKIYYFNSQSKSQSVFKLPPEGVSDFVTNYTERCFWKWNSLDVLLSNDSIEPSSHSLNNSTNNKITRAKICEYINGIIKPK